MAGPGKCLVVYAEVSAKDRRSTSDGEPATLVTSSPEHSRSTAQQGSSPRRPSRCNRPNGFQPPGSAAPRPRSCSRCAVAGDDATSNSLSDARTCFHITHLSSGFMGEPAGHLNTCAKSAFCDTTPLVRKTDGACSSEAAKYRWVAVRSLSHQFWPNAMKTYVHACMHAWMRHMHVLIRVVHSLHARTRLRRCTNIDAVIDQRSSITASLTNCLSSNGASLPCVSRCHAKKAL